MDSLKNVTLKVIIHELLPYTSVTNISGEVILTGFIGEMWNILEKFLEFKSEYRMAGFSEGKEILKKKEADVMLTPIVFDGDNAKDFDSPGPVGSSTASLYMMDADDRANSSSFITTWEPDLWLAYGTVLVLCTFLLWFMANVRRWTKPKEKAWKTKTLELIANRKSVNRKAESTEIDEKLSAWDSVIAIFGAATQQDTDIKVSKVSSTRIMLVTFLFFVSLTTTSYNSMLVSRLTVAQNSYRISLDGIPSPNKLFVCVRTNSAVYSKFVVNGSQKLQPRWRDVVNKGPCHPDPKTAEEVATNLCQKGVVVFESGNIMSKLLSTGLPCQMVRLRITKVLSYISILFKKRLKYAYPLKQGIMNIRNSGVLNLLEDRFLATSARDVPKEQVFQEVTIDHVMGLIMVYGAAIVVSLIILVLELIVHKYSREHNAIKHGKRVLTRTANLKF